MLLLLLYSTRDPKVNVSSFAASMIVALVVVAVLCLHQRRRERLDKAQDYDIDSTLKAHSVFLPCSAELLWLCRSISSFTSLFKLVFVLSTQNIAECRDWSK